MKEPAPLTIRNLSTTPLAITRVERFPSAGSSWGITSFLYNTTSAPSSADLAQNAIGYSFQDSSIVIPPYQTVVCTNIDLTKPHAKETRRIIFSTTSTQPDLDITSKFRFDLHSGIPSGASITVTSLTPESSSEFCGVYHQDHNHISLLSQAKLHKWMSNLNASTPLSALSIPGTHNSPTCHKALPSVRCQARSVKTQLEHGARFLDVRCQPSGKDIILVHGAFHVSHVKTHYLHELLKVCYTFLDKNPGETVMLSLKREGRGNSTDQKFAKILYERFIKPDEGRWYTQPHVPTISECRGKVILVRRFTIDETVGMGDHWGIDADNWELNSENCLTRGGDLCVQDFFEVVESVNITKKTTYACAHLERAGAAIANLESQDVGQRQPLFLNFLSASNFWAKSCWPEKIAQKLNPSIIEFLSIVHGNKDQERYGVKVENVGDGQTGVVVCDWVGMEGEWALCRLIVSMNGRLELRERKDMDGV